MSFSFRTLTIPFFALLPLVQVCAKDTNSVVISMETSVQIPEKVLAPGSYTFDVEDRLPDRAIVRVTEANGASHLLLTVPVRTLPKSKGLIYFDESSHLKALHAWDCPSCTKPLEFVYPKEEAVKLTAETGHQVLAYDPSYDKLPDNLTADDRKVVTLWLLSPKRVTGDGRGEGLMAAKYSSGKTDVRPRRMPKTASGLYLEMASGFLLLLSAALLQGFKLGKVSYEASKFAN